MQHLNPTSHEEFILGNKHEIFYTKKNIIFYTMKHMKDMKKNQKNV